MAILRGHQVAFTKPSFNTRDGTLEITENGEYTIETYEKVDVQVEGGGGGTGTIPFANIFDCIESAIEVSINA